MDVDTLFYLNLSIYLWAAIFFVIFTAKCFFTGWKWKPSFAMLKNGWKRKQTDKLQRVGGSADGRKELSSFRAVLLLLVSPSSGYFFSVLINTSITGDVYSITADSSQIQYILCSAGIQLLAHMVCMAAYIGLVRAMNASMAMFVYLCSAMLVPEFYTMLLSQSLIPMLCYVGLHILFYFLAVIPAAELTGARQTTNVGLFAALPAATYLFNTLMFSFFVWTQGRVTDTISEVKMLATVRELLDPEMAVRFEDAYNGIIDFMRYQQNFVLYPSIFVTVVLIVAFSVIMRNIKYMNETRLAQRDLKELSVEVMEALAHTIDAKDEYTRGHSIRVARYARMIAEKMGYTGEQCENIYYMGLLHDIGKIGVPNEIINKPTRLTDEEYDVIKKHPMTGNDILMEIKSHPELAIGARWHHERYDGKGYPDHKTGEEIPIEARIIAVADTYDAMTSNRSYRSYLPQKAVREEIEKNIGTQFDEAPARCMIQIMDEDTEYVLHE